MPHKPGIYNCLKEHWKDPNVKIRCGECQSCKGQEVSEKIRQQHVPGKFCKKSNLCTYCSQVKYLIRCIRHVCGCRCGRKCELCNSPESVAKVFEHQFAHHFKRLYLLMLPQEPKIRPNKPRPSWMSKRKP